MRSTTVLHFLGWILLIWSRCSFEALAKYQSKQTGSRGDRLLIGSLYPVRSFHDVMPTIAFFGIRCTPGGNQENFTLGIYKIRDKYYEDDYGMGESEIRVTKEVKLSDYFLTVYRRAWLCKPAGRPDLTDEFVSINTVIISIKDIYNIRYEEGVDVYLQKFDVDRVKVVERLCVAKDVVNNTYSFPFKCLDDWRYEQETEEISHIPDLAVEILKNPPRPVDDELEEDVPVQENSTSISDNGPSIRIEPSPSTIDKPNKKYVCQNSFVNTELFLPKCYQKFDGHYALIPQEEFGKRFMIIDREVQICESGENDRIFRISHTVIGRTNISNIEYGNGIIELYAIKLPDGGRSIRYTEVRYFYAKTRKPVMDYNVQYTFANIERVKSSVEVATDGTFEPIDIEYKLPPGSIFRLLISPEGYNLRLGSRPVADIDADDVVCQRLFNHHQIEYGINIEIITDDQNGLRHTLVHNTELIHIDTWDQIVYSCASVTNQSVHFLRVMNFLVTNNAPIHYIETYDGVEFIRFNERNGNDLLQIIEVKYLLNGTAVRFVGTLYAQGDNILSSYQLGLTPYIIKKGEIYPLPNTDVPTREHILRDYQWNGEQYEHFKNEKDQEKTMRLEVNGDSNLAANQPQVIICRANETLVERFPFFKIMKETTEIESMSSDTDRTFNEKYFDNMKSEKWLCREILPSLKRASTSSSPNEIVRVITKQTLRRPNDICVIEHTPLDRLWFEMYNNDYQTKMEGIRYYQKEGENLKLYNNLNSYVIFEHDSSTGVGQWKSGTKQLDNFNGKSKKVFETQRYDESDYNPKMMYHLNVSRSQYAHRTLLMGSKWTKIYGNSRTNLICAEEKELAERELLNNGSLYLTKVSQRGSGSNKNKFHVDFKLLTLKIWKCTDKDNSKLSLYGVMNTFTMEQSYDYHYNGNRVTLKEIKFYDGVTVLHGKVPGPGDMENYEFTEFKYLDVADMSSVKFEGSIEMASGSGLAQVSTTLINMAAKDTAYVLNQAVPGRNEVFRTKINNKGVTLQIGEILPPDPDARSIHDLYCYNSRDGEQLVAQIKSIGFPRILKFNSTHHPVLMTLNELPNFFDLKQEVQYCTTVTDDSHRTSNVYYRIVTVLKVKNRTKIGQIYHYDEVSIRDSDNQLTIEEVKYILCESKTQKDESTKRTYRKVRLDRFVSFPEADEKEQFMERHMYHREKINYRLDKELWRLSNVEETGVTIQVQSHFDKTINIGHSGNFVTCLKIKDHPVANPKYNSKICSNIGSEVEEMKYVDVSEIPALKQVSQEVWRCTGAEDFIIVQNKMISTDSRMRVYHRPPATAVGTLFLPNGGKALQISDQRFLKEEQRGDGEYEYKVIKFLGSMNLVLETLPEADTFPKHTIAVPVRILAKRTSRHIWTLDSLRLVAFRDLQLARRLISAVHYIGNINQQYLHTKILDSGASRMFQLGRFYDKVLDAEDLHQRKPLECIQCPWDSKYTPTVTEYVGMHSYTMDKETFYENFQVINVAVWLCSNKFNELLRVRTVYEPKQEMPIFAVRYTDGIEVEVSKDGKKLIRVNEILYMDVLALDVYRYDGRLKERILPPITPVTESDSEGETENYEEDLVILNKPPKNLRSNAAAIRATGVKSVQTIIGLFRCLTPYFKKPKRGNSKKPPQSPPGKPKA